MLAQVRRAVARLDSTADAGLDRIRGHRAVDRTMYAASELGDWSLIWHLVGVGQALLPGRPALSAVRLSVILGVESVVVNGGVKQLFRRGRPEWTAVAPRPHRLRTPRTTSFPSGHASSAFTAAGVLSAGGDPLWPLYYGLAVVVASSRAYVKIHHLSDVLAGAALGAGMAAVANELWPSPG